MKCIVIGSGEFKEKNINVSNSDFVIASDGGYIYCVKQNIKVDLLVGDFDSLHSVPQDIETIRLSKEKDETDTYMCIKEGIKRGYTEFELYGCLGGRIEHTLANIQIIVKFKKENIDLKLINGNTRIYCLKEKEEHLIVKNHLKFISVFSHTDNSIISIKGLKYNLDNYKLTNMFPLGLDNETTSSNGYIYVKSGIVIIVENFNN